MIRIDRLKIYESHGYKFKNFVCLTEEEKLMILEWRNHEKVRNMMVNKDIIPLENHLAFIEGLKKREDCYYWLVTNSKGVDVGVLDVIHIDNDKEEGELGYYINPNEFGGGFDFMIECNYFVYQQLKLKFNLVTVDVRNKDILLFCLFMGTTFEGIKEIDGVKYLYNNHTIGDYLVSHYNELSFVNYAKFIKHHKDDNYLYNIKID